MSTDGRAAERQRGVKEASEETDSSDSGWRLVLSRVACLVCVCAGWWCERRERVVAASVDATGRPSATIERRLGVQWLGELCMCGGMGQYAAAASGWSAGSVSRQRLSPFQRRQLVPRSPHVCYQFDSNGSQSAVCCLSVCCRRLVCDVLVLLLGAAHDFETTPVHAAAVRHMSRLEWGWGRGSQAEWHDNQQCCCAVLCCAVLVLILIVLPPPLIDGCHDVEAAASDLHFV